MINRLHTNFSDSAANSSLPYNDEEFSFNSFAPTLAQCYGIVFAGFLLAKLEILSASDVRGVSAFASYVAMPAIICTSIADADLENLRWELLMGIALGKAIIFVVVAAAALVISKPINGAAAGTYALFCVQCNDLPVGNPLLSSLYRYERPHMMKYLFFVPVITLILFTPLTFLLAEKYSNGTAQSRNTECSTRLRKRILNFLKVDVVKHPVVIATILGIFLNLVFKAKVPPALHHPIHVLAATIPGIALSNLGFVMCGKERFLFSSCIVLSIVLIFIKMVFTPLILHSAVKNLAWSSSQWKELSDFALLYGIISPAAVVFQTAQNYSVSIAAMSASLILSSLTCFPLSYFIAQLTIVTKTDFKSYIPTISYVFFYASCASLICCVYTLASFVRDRNWKKKSHLCVANLIFGQMMVNTGVITWSIKGVSTLIGESLFLFGELSVDMWVAALFCGMVFQPKYPQLFKKNLAALMGSSFSLSAVLTVIHGVLAAKNELRSTLMLGVPHGSFDRMQMMVTTVVLSCSLTVSCCGIAKHFRRLNNQGRRRTGIYNICFLTEEFANSQNKLSGEISKSTSALFGDDCMKSYYCNIVGNEAKKKHLVFGAVWTPRLLGLLVLISLIMMVRLALKILKLFNCTENAVMIPLELLQASLFAGQGVVSWLTFGIDLRTITISVRKWFHSWGEKEEKDDELEQEDKDSLSRFRYSFEKEYYSRCFASLADERMWKDRYYADSFWGHQLVDWLLSNGLASDRVDAEEFGERLLMSNAIRHVNEAHHFHDAPYLYHFVK